MKQSTLHIFALTVLFALAQGCISFPEDSSEPQEMLYSGVQLDAVEKIDNEPLYQTTFAKKVEEALTKVKINSRPIKINDTETAAVVISVSVDTRLLRRIPTPGLDQGEYRTTLSVSFFSNYKSSIEDPDALFFQKAVYKNVMSSTPEGAAKKGAEWAADYFINNYINELFKRHVPISKFPKKKSEQPPEPIPES